MPAESTIRQAPKAELSVVIPLYNEGDILDDVLPVVQQALLTAEKPRYELILIDDGSSDNSWARIAAWAAKDPRIFGLRLSRNFGKEAAIAAGLERASGEAVLLMDGDLQHPPDLIPRMVSLWHESDVDIVEAVKANRGKEPWWHRLAARLFYSLPHGIPGAELRGATDFKLMNRRALDAWLQLGERNLFFRGMSAWLGFRRATLPFAVPGRAGGRSRWSLVGLLRLALTGFTAFTSLPLHFTTLIGLCFLTFSVILGSHTLYMKFSGQAVSGFTTVILLLLIMGSCILISLGVIGLYIARIYEEVKARPRYLVAESTGKDPS